MKVFILTIAVVLSITISFAQELTQTIKGKIMESGTEAPIAFASIAVLGTEPQKGAISDSLGYFKIEDVPVGRYDILVSNLGYEDKVLTEIVLSSSKEVYVEVRMKEKITTLDEIVVKPTLDKENTINEMSILSRRMLSVEESKRYAGGFDDPARLASSFAGAISGVNNNAIVVRGNAPKSLQWKMEGIEIPNPNHFANLASVGGGALTGLSGQLLGNSDFLTGAFPAEYNNALSGVFDIFMRTGNNENRETTFQIGALGIDFASEGPFKKGGQSSYLFNYRYSSFGIVSHVTDANQGIKFQDLSFKLNFPTKKAGTFSVWGIGLIDGIVIEEQTDSTEWKYESDKENYDAQQYMAASGISHKILLGNSALLKTTLGTTVYGTDWEIKQLDSDLQLSSKSDVQNTNWNIVLKSELKTKFSKSHTNKTGFSATMMSFDMLLKDKTDPTLAPQVIVNEQGTSTLFSGYSHSLMRMKRLTFSAGVNVQYFDLNQKVTLEPRAGIKYTLSENQAVGFAYGLHSRLERLSIYLSKNPITGDYQNKDLDFSKAHHFIAQYQIKASKNLVIKVEPYYQYLFNIPVVKNSPTSLINLKDNWFVTDDFVNTGKGRNYGIDLTIEKFFSKGYYFLITGSLFKSEYQGGDSVWRSTRFDRNYVINILGGKEWQVGKNNQNVFSLNARLNYMGGERYIPYSLQESIAAQTVVYDYSKSFSESIDPAFIFHFTISYKMNRKKTSHEFALKFLNATSYGDFQGLAYNKIDKTVDETCEVIFIPNISYRIDF